VGFNHAEVKYNDHIVTSLSLNCDSTPCHNICDGNDYRVCYNLCDRILQACHIACDTVAIVTLTIHNMDVHFPHPLRANNHWELSGQIL